MQNTSDGFEIEKDPRLQRAHFLWFKSLPPLTPWFPHNKLPVRPGVYMVDQSWPNEPEQCVYSWWNGKNWHVQGSTPDDAMKWIAYGPIKRGPYRPPAFKQWRGILKDV